MAMLVIVQPNTKVFSPCDRQTDMRTDGQTSSTTTTGSFSKKEKNTINEFAPPAGLMLYQLSYKKRQIFTAYVSLGPHVSHVVKNLVQCI